MCDEFVCEPIEPDRASFDPATMARGEPGVPRRFTWRGREHVVASVTESWKKTGPCRHGSGERYVRRHYYRVVTTSGEVLTIFFERRSRSPRKAGPRWWVYTVSTREA